MMRGYGFYDGYGMMGGGWFGLAVMLLLWLVLVGGVVLLIVWAVRATQHHGSAGPTGSPGPTHGGAPGHDEAVAVARRRYAAGEITKDQFDEIMRGLG